MPLLGTGGFFNAGGGGGGGGGISARYWRWNFTEQFSNPALQQIELFEATGGDVSGMATMTASSSEGGQPPSNTTDNLQTTFWRANGTAPQWLKADFGLGNEKEIVLGALWHLASIKTVSLQYSNNDTTWADFFTPVTFAAAVPGVWTGRFFNSGGVATGSKRIWRINVTASNGYNGIIVSNLEFRTSVGGADQTTPGNQLGPALDTVFGGEIPSFGFDDNTFNVARSNNGFPAWLQYDFGFTDTVANTKDVVQIAMTASGNDAPMDFDIQYSDDGGATFNTSWSVTGEVSWGTNETRVFTKP